MIFEMHTCDLVLESYHRKKNAQKRQRSSRIDPKNMNEILEKFNSWKILDTVEDYSDHYYSNKRSYAGPPSKNWAKRIQAEWKILEKNLPGTISVRVYESRMDLMRVVIVGAKGTPYHDGLYFFDAYFPNDYPNVPPHVHYCSGVLNIHPNVVPDGVLCISLLNTNVSPRLKLDKWIPGTSTMLQVLVSIQGLVLNAKPYFGFIHSIEGSIGEKAAVAYNETVVLTYLRTMLYYIRYPQKNFEDFVVGYFAKNGRDILVCCRAYMDGAQVGCLAEGGIQDVDEGDKTCSRWFKIKLSNLIDNIVDTFSQVGAKDCEEFRALAERKKAF